MLWASILVPQQGPHGTWHSFRMVRNQKAYEVMLAKHKVRWHQPLKDARYINHMHILYGPH